MSKWFLWGSINKSWRLKRVLERLEGPAVSMAVHILIVFLLITHCVGTRTKPATEFEVTMLDPSADDTVLDALELEPKDELQSEDFVTDMEIPDPGIAEAVQAVDVSDSLAIHDNESPLELMMPAGSGLMLDNSVSSLQLQRSAKTAFGFDKNIKGDLVGTMYDFKRDASKRPRGADYYADLRRVVGERFSKKVMKDFYRVPKQLFLTHLFLPYVKAETGPEAFGAGGLMEPTKWIIHYTGQIQTLLAGRFRFVGEFDDIVIVFVDGKVVLEAGWGDHVAEWRPTDNVGKHLCYTTHPLVYGDWVDLQALQPHRIDIVVGENPGGWVGGLLMLQEEGREYASDAKGRPVLPIFTVQPLTPEDLKIMRSVSGWRFDEHTPIMGVRQERLAAGVGDTDEVVVVVE